MRCDADLRCDACEVCDSCRTAYSDCFHRPSGQRWLFEYMGDIHMSEVASLSVKKTVRCDADLRCGACEGM